MKYEIVCGHWTVHADGVKTVLYVGKDEKENIMHPIHIFFMRKEKEIHVMQPLFFT